MTTIQIIYSAIAFLVLAGVFMLGLSKRKPKARLFDADGKTVKVTEETKTALIAEYKLIQRKQSKFSNARRKKMVQLVDHLVSTGEINDSQLKQ